MPSAIPPRRRMWWGEAVIEWIRGMGYLAYDGETLVPAARTEALVSAD